MNIVVLVGRLTKDPELRFLPGSGRAVARFTIAVDKGLSKEKRDELTGQGKPTADFIPVVVWGKQAENCANYLEKGRKAIVEGSIQTGSYDNESGQKVYTTEVLASRVQFLEWKEKSETNSMGGFQVIDDDVPF